MEAQRVDTQRAYELLLDMITTLNLRPGAAISEQQLSGELTLALSAVQEALRMLEREHLVRLTPRHGAYVADINIPDLERISELRLALESLAAGFAAQRATPDDLAVLDAIRQEQATTDPADARRLFHIDHKFHQAVAAAAHNVYLAETLSHLFGLSLRFWYLLLPAEEAEAAPARLESLTEAMQRHVDLVTAISAHDADAAQRVMRAHVDSFYRSVRTVLAARQ